MRRARGHGLGLWMIAGAAAGMAAFGCWWVGVGAAAPPEWAVRIEESVPRIEPSAGSRLTPEASATQARLLNDILRRPTWGVEEASDVAGVIRAGYPRAWTSRGGLTDAEFSAAMVHTAAMLAAIARLEAGAPVDAAARAVVVETLVDELAHPFAERRSGAAVALIVTRSIEDPAVRGEVERLLDDADSETAQIVALQLTHYDDQRSGSLASAAESAADGD